MCKINWSFVEVVMGLLGNVWRKMSNSKALQSSGELEMLFFETIYRVTYLVGISAVDDSIPYLIYSTTVKSMIVLLVLGEMWFATTETTNLDEIAGAINTIVIQFITYYRYSNMVNYKEVYRELAKSMESPYFDITTKKRKTMVVNWAQKNEKYLKLLLLLGNLTLLAWFSHPLVDDLEYNLPVTIRLPFEYRSPKAYVFAYLLVLSSFAYISHFVMVTDLIMQAHLVNLACQFAILGDRFEEIVVECDALFRGVSREQLLLNEEFKGLYMKTLGDLVNQHQSTLSHVMVLRRILSGPMLGQLAASGILICFIGYQAITTGADNVTKLLMSLFFLGYNLFEFFIICRWAEEITIQSERVREAVYFSNWECGVATLPGVRSSLLLIVDRANTPLHFTAGGMYVLSLQSYTSLVKASYSALTVLLRFRQN